MLGFIANILAGLGQTIANASTAASFWWLFDEPEMPESLED